METFGLSVSTSRIKTYLMCPFKYFMEYVMKVERVTTFPALHGTIIHAILERYDLGHRKNWGKELLHIWKKEQPFRYHKNFKKDKPKSKGSSTLVHSKDCPYCDFLDRGFEHFHGSPSQLFIKDKNCPLWHFKEAVMLVQEVLDRPHSPFHLEHIAVEQRFKLDIGDDVKISGIIDKVSKLDSDSIQIRDWKTGNWLPTLDELRNDPQLRLYDLAASILYPDYNNRILTFDYLKHDEFSFVITDEEREENRKWIIDIAKEIQATHSPDRISTNPEKNRRDWKCRALCNAELCNTLWPARESLFDMNYSDDETESFLDD